MRFDKQLAIELRLKGKTYNEINETLGVAKSTLSGWLRNVKLSKKIESELLNKKQRSWRKTIIVFNKKRAEKIRAKSKTDQEKWSQEIKNLTEKELKLVGTALYWAEGYKKNK